MDEDSPRGAAQHDSESVTYWFDQLRAGNEQAAAELWTHYFEQLSRFARSRLKQRRVRDEEDLASEVLHALCMAADAGKLPSIDSRDDLWRILISWLRSRIVDQVRADQAAKRGGGHVRGHSALAIDGSQADGFHQLPGPQPSPATLIEMRDCADHLLKQLPDALLQKLALARLAGKSVAEMAHEFQIAPRTVERKLAIIRRVWSERTD